jgi:hypothetical protein
VPSTKPSPKSIQVFVSVDFILKLPTIFSSQIYGAKTLKKVF